MIDQVMVEISSLDPRPNDVMRFWVEDDVLHAEFRDGSTWSRDDQTEEWVPA
jgi:hypothetical protein